MERLIKRKRFLLELGASDYEAEELVQYNTNRFDRSLLSAISSLPLADEPFTAAWDGYARDAEDKGVHQVLKKKLVQLAFPVKEGISHTEAYKAVTLRGEDASLCKEATGLFLCQPEKIKLFLHPTVAGKIPVIVLPDRRDFVSFVQALSFRNEPKALPDSMGACTIQGYNNWDRIKQYKTDWLRCHPGGDWILEFLDFKEKTELYRDRLIVLSDGAYSGASAEAMGLGTDEWLKKSMIIRLEHECTHYMTRRLLGSMQNNIFDELLADFRGVLEAFNEYRAVWFLTFMGLEDYPKYRIGGRLENYRGEPPLSDNAFRVLQILTVKAAINLEHIDEYYFRKNNKCNRILMLLALLDMTLEEIARESIHGDVTEHLFNMGALNI